MSMVMCVDRGTKGRAILKFYLFKFFTKQCCSSKCLITFKFGFVFLLRLTYVQIFNITDVRLNDWLETLSVAARRAIVVPKSIF